MKMRIDITNKEKTLHQIRSGLKWLTSEYKDICLDFKSVPDKRWEKLWERAVLIEDMDRWIRKFHDFKGCIWGEFKCPKLQFINCDKCTK
jgi:hypothetical protein